MNGRRIDKGGKLLATGLVAVLTAALFPACSTMREAQSSAAQKVELNGLSYQVEQITASTWSARPPVGLANSAQQNIALIKAIEKASGCKVTDSNAGLYGKALNAQVDCGSRLKN